VSVSCLVPVCRGVIGHESTSQVVDDLSPNTEADFVHRAEDCDLALYPRPCPYLHPCLCATVVDCVRVDNFRYRGDYCNARACHQTAVGAALVIQNLRRLDLQQKVNEGYI
jgi:hypothetical protein